MFFVVLAGLIVAPWTKPGYLLLLDWTSGPATTMSNATYGLASDQANSMPVRLVLQVIRGVVGAGVAGWLPILVALAAAGTGTAALVGGSSWRRRIAGTAFVVNPFVFERLRAGHIYLLLGMAVLPWLVASALAAKRSGSLFRVRTAAVFALAVTCSPHLFWIGLVALAAVTFTGGIHRNDLIRLALTLVAVCATMAYALALQSVGVHTVAVDDADLAAYATRGGGGLGTVATVLSLHGFWRGGATPATLWGPVWPVLVALGVWLSVRVWREHRVQLAPIRFMVIAGALLACGTQGPTGWLFRMAFSHIPLFSVMREPQKFTMLVALGWALTLAHTVDAVDAKLMVPVVRKARLVMWCLVPLLSAPNLLWGLGGTVKVSHYPSSWTAADAAMGDGDGSVLVLPWYQYRPYSFTDGRTVRDPVSAYFRREVIASDATDLPGLRTGSSSPRSAYLDRLMARASTLTRFGRFVAPLDVKYVIASSDAALTRGADITWLDRQVDLSLVLRRDDLVVYRNTAFGVGRVGSARTVASFNDYVRLVEDGTIGTEAVFVDPTAATDTSTRSTSLAAGGVSKASPTSYAVGSGATGWVVIPTPAASGWRLDGDGGRRTVQGVIAFAAGEQASKVSYAPWYVVRRGYAISFLTLVALFVIGVLEHRQPIAQSRAARWFAVRGRLEWRRFRTSVASAYVLVWLVGVVAVNAWFRPANFVATGDMGPFIRRGWQPEAFWSWNHAITGAGSASYVMARWYEFLLTWAVHALGGSDTLTQRLFYMTIYPMVGLGVAAVIGVFTRNRWGIFVGGSFAVLNGFFLTRLPNPLNIISVGSVALVTAVGLRVAKGRKLPAPLLGISMLFMSFLTYNPPMLTVALVWTALGVPFVALAMWGRKALWRIARYAVTAAPWALVINIFWLLPFAQAFTGGGGASATAQTDPTAWAWSQAQNNIPNVLTLSANWAWYKPQYLPFTPALDQPLWIWLRYLLPVIVVASPVLVLRQRRRVALVLATLVAIFAVLAKGLQPPFTNFNMLLYNVVPGFWLFREPMSKLGQLLIMFEGALIALSIEGVIAKTKSLPDVRRRLMRAPIAFASSAVLLWPYPLIIGTVIPDERPLQPPAHVQVPSFWRTTASMIDANPAEGKVLVLPLDDYYQMPTTWGFSGVDSIAGLLLRHPVLQRHPDGYFGDVPGLAAQVDAIEQALVAGDVRAVPPLLSSLGVRWVIVRHDLVLGNPLRMFQNPTLLGAALDRVDGVRLVQEGSLDVYEVVRSATPTVRGTTAPLAVPNTPDAISDAVASLPLGQSVIGEGDSVTNDALNSGDALSASDGVWWAVPPAARNGDVSTTFTSTGGEFAVHQRSRAAVPMVVDEVPTVTGRSRVALRLSDPTTVLVDGKVASKRNPVLYPLARRGVVAVRAGNRTVSLDAWAAGSMPDGTNAADRMFTVPVGADTRLTAWALAKEPAKVSPYSGVYDCNNYEPRPASELRLSVARLTDPAETGGGAPITRLSANDHAACVQHGVGGVTAGDTVRVRVEYRTIEGQRPQVCLLERLTTGDERCVFDERLRSSADWGRYEIVHTLGSDVVSVSVVLYANVGLRLSPRTVTDYRSLKVDRLERVLNTKAWPAGAPVQTVSLTPGEHTLTIRGGSYGSLLAPFEPLEDCFRYDDQNFEESGLAATVTDDNGEYLVDGEQAFPPGAVVELRATDHMACLASTMRDYGGAGLYELSYDYRSVAIRKPKVAVYHRGPNVAQPLRANGAEKEWTTFREPLKPYLNAVETRLYLYGPRDLTGTQQAIVQYRDVSVVPVASSSTISLLRTDHSPIAIAPLSSTPRTPAAYTATSTVLDDQYPDRSGKQVVVALGETVAPGWVATKLPDGVVAEKVTLNGWQNGWVLTVPTAQDESVSFSMVYAPAFLARTALKISLLALPGACMWMLVRRRVRAAVGRRMQALRLRLRPYAQSLVVLVLRLRGVVA